MKVRIERCGGAFVPEEGDEALRVVYILGADKVHPEDRGAFMSLVKEEMAWKLGRYFRCHHCDQKAVAVDRGLAYCKAHLDEGWKQEGGEPDFEFWRRTLLGDPSRVGILPPRQAALNLLDVQLLDHRGWKGGGQGSYGGAMTLSLLWRTFAGTHLTIREVSIPAGLSRDQVGEAVRTQKDAWLNEVLRHLGS